MWKNYFKIAWRQLVKNKLYSLVNISGLTLGIACCILIGMYISQELSFDRWHANAGRIVRVSMEYGVGDGGVKKTAVTGTKAGPQFARLFPQIESFVRIDKFSRVVGYRDKIFDEGNFLYADSSFFNIFSFRLSEGNAATALNAPGTLVLTKSMAAKYFGAENPMGKILRVGDSRDFVVTGVADDPPPNSQLQFGFIASFTSLHAASSEEWWSANYLTYLLLKKNTKTADLQKGITTYMRQIGKEATQGYGSYLTYNLEPLTSVHLYSEITGGFEPGGNIIYIYILAVIALLILCIACVNYINLATAQSASRTGEIGIRKVMGAQRGQLYRQFIGESFFLSFLSITLAVLAAIWLLPLFNRISGKTLAASGLLHPLPLLSLGAIGVLVTFAGGYYPAFIVSNFKLVRILKSGFNFTSGGKNLRQSLIVFQFVISVFLVIFTIILLQQLQYVRNKDLGYDKSHIVVLPLDWNMHAGYYGLKDALSISPGVKSITGATESPIFVQWSDALTTGQNGEGKSLSIKAMLVDLGFTKTLGLTLLTGSDFTPADYQQDTSEGGKNRRNTYILNETAVRALGWTPQNAVGRTIYKGLPGTVKAVVKDFHIASMHEAVSPLLIIADTSQVQEMLVKVSGERLSATLQQMEKTWKERAPHRPFEYHFLDEDYDRLYLAEQRTAKVFGSFSALAIFLGCLGLLALAAYSTVQRTKEIGIRKVLGASVTSIMSLLSKDFIRLVLIAVVIAIPLAWYASWWWLQSFVYRVKIEPWVFVLGTVATLLTALVAVSFQTIRAAMANPVKNLKTD